MPQDLTDDKSTLVQVMAWCRQAISHYLNKCWPRSPTPYGVTRPQWLEVNGFSISPPDGLFWWFWSNQEFAFDFSFTFWQFADIIDDFEAIKYLILYLISHSPSESLLTLWTTASGMPISWIPTSDGWIRISGIANRSLFKRIVWNTQQNINSCEYRCHTSDSQLYMQKKTM